jgi:hypothetical protein
MTDRPHAAVSSHLTRLAGKNKRAGPPNASGIRNARHKRRPADLRETVARAGNIRWTVRVAVIAFRGWIAMNAKSQTTLLSVIAASCALVSCAAFKNTTASAAEKFSELAKMPKMPSLTDTPIARLLPAGGLKVVEVREKDLKDLPTGQERAIAYRNERKRGFWIFGGPVDYEEPTLPEDGSGADGSLLPPRMP